MLASKWLGRRQSIGRRIEEFIAQVVETKRPGLFSEVRHDSGGRVIPEQGAIGLAVDRCIDEDVLGSVVAGTIECEYLGDRGDPSRAVGESGAADDQADRRCNLR